MREIKFRAWIEDLTTGGNPTKEMETYEKLLRYENPLNPMISDLKYYDIDPSGKLVWMQYTGLKDRNDKEIYEGDILQWWNGKELIGDKKVVKPTDGGWNPFIDDIQTDGAWHFEILGNIYENPELLERK